MRLWSLLAALLALVLIGLNWLGCSTGGAAGAQDDAPLHLHVVCLAAVDGQAVTCESAERLAAVETWVHEALVRPHSTLTVWAVGSNRHHVRPFFTACVPAAWGPGVMEAKEEFVKAVREGVNGRGRAAVPPSCVPPAPLNPGSHRLQVSPAVAPVRPEVWTTVAARAAAGEPLHMAIVCDRSDSTQGLVCLPLSLLGAFDWWLAVGVATTASLSVYVVGTSRDTAQLVYTLTVPPRSVGEQVAVVLGARAELTALLPASGAQQGEENECKNASAPRPAASHPQQKKQREENECKNASAIAEAISVAGSALRERVGQHRLVLLSDLRQYTRGAWNFERSVPTTREFVAWWRSTNLWVNLEGIPVLACGLHHHRSPGAPPHTATLATHVRDTWSGTLHALGATDVRLFSTCQEAFPVP